ncbi:cyclic pyranopterin phosphate synthase [Alteromonadaceae bacterium 2753L.S.0a.02]|nr:cyclic pyranopterin phosphate synthase [Alteromonadaceae bacterium 2753L.S.0a.02]
MTETILTDTYQRRFTYLRLSITDACNFRCNYCLPEGYRCESREPYLSLAEIRQISTAFALNGTKKIRITGGEPTLRKDLPEIISLCSNTPGIENIALTSNGYRITKLLPTLVNAGLTAINLSADSLQPEQFQLITGHNKLREVLSGIELALSLGIKTVKLNVVLLKQYNAKELTSFIAFVKHLPISLRFIELMRTGDNAVFFDQQHISGRTIQDTLEQQGWQPAVRAPHAGPAVEFSHPDYQGRIGLIMPYSRNFCTTCNRLRVSSQGNLHLCLFAEEHKRLRDLMPCSDDELANHLKQLILSKRASHDLHQNNSGSTKHLAMLGG